MIKKRKSIRSDEAGTVLVIVALLLPVIFAMAGLGIDVSNWAREQRLLQTAADSGALAGAYEIANSRTQTQATSAANSAAQSNGYNPATGNTLDVTYGTSGSYTTVKVSISQKVDVWFSKIILGGTTPSAQVTATAEVNATDGPYCMLALNKTSSGAISTSGAVNINAADCGLAINSSSSSALSLNGNVNIAVGSVTDSGGVNIVGGSDTFTYTSERLNANPTTDPYANLAVQGEPKTCSTGQQKTGTLKITGDYTLDPSNNPFCGGINISSTGTITMKPGTYYIDGGDFSVAANSGGSLVGTGVTIVLMSSTGSSSIGRLDIEGGKNVELTAPTTGYYAGITVFQDRNANSQNANQGNKLMGNAQLTMSGVAYTPSEPFTFGGNSAYTGFSGQPCSKIIADTITFAGNPTMGRNCVGSGTKSIGVASVALIQ